MLERLKSPIVIIQLITLIGGTIALLAPQFDNTQKIIVGAVVGVISIISGLNNPTDKENF